MEDGRLAAELDDLYSRTQAQIEAVLGDGTLNRGLRVRAKAWLSAMRLPTLNTVWKRNRNQHARLLLAQLRAGVLQAPFDALPPQNGLPTLQPWMIYRFMSPTRRGASPTKSGGNTPSGVEDLLEREDIDTSRHTPPGAAFIEGIHSAEAAQHRIRHGINTSPKRSSHFAATPKMEAHELRAGLTEADGRANLSDWRAEAAMSQMSKQDRELNAARQESEELMRQVSQSAAEHERAQGAAKVAAKLRLDALIQKFEGKQAEWQPERASDAARPRQEPAPGALSSYRDPAIGVPSSRDHPAPGAPFRGSAPEAPSSYRDHAADAPSSYRGPATSRAPPSEPSLRGSLQSMPLSQSSQDPNQRIRRKLMELEDANAQFQRSGSAASRSLTGVSKSMQSSASRQQLQPVPRNLAAEPRPDRPTSLNPNPMSPSPTRPERQQQPEQQQAQTRPLASQTNASTQRTHAPSQTSLASLAPPSELPPSSSTSHASSSRALLPLKALSFTGATDASTRAASSSSSGGHPSSISNRSRAGSEKEEAAKHSSTASAYSEGMGRAAGPGSKSSVLPSQQQQQQQQQGYGAGDRAAGWSPRRGSDQSARQSPVKDTQLLGDLQDLLHEVDDAVGGENIRPPSNISLSTASKASSQQLHPRHSALAEQSIPQEHAGRTTTATGTHAPGSSVLGGSSKGLSIAAGGGASGMAGGGDGNGGPGSAAERPNSGGSGGGGRQRGKLQGLREELQQQLEQQRQRQRNGTGSVTLSTAPSAAAGSGLRGSISSGGPCSVPSMHSDQEHQQVRQDTLPPGSAPQAHPDTLPQRNPSFSFCTNPSSPRSSRIAPLTLASIPESPCAPPAGNSQRSSRITPPAGNSQPLSSASGGGHQPPKHASHIAGTGLGSGLFGQETTTGGVGSKSSLTSLPASTIHPPASARWESQLQHRSASDLPGGGSSCDDAATHSTYRFSATSGGGGAQGSGDSGGLNTAAAGRGAGSGAFGGSARGAHASGMHGAASGLGAGGAPGSRNSSSACRAGSPISEQRLASPRLRISPDPILLTLAPGHRYARCPFSAPASRDTSPARCTSLRTSHPTATSPSSPTRSQQPSQQQPHSPYRHRPPNYHELPSNTTAFPYYPATVPGRSPSAPPSRPSRTSAFGDLNLPARPAIFQDTSPERYPGARPAASSPPSLFQPCAQFAAPPPPAIFRDASPTRAPSQFGVKPVDGGLHVSGVPPYSGGSREGIGRYPCGATPSYATSACPSSAAAADWGSSMFPPMASSSSRGCVRGAPPGREGGGGGWYAPASPSAAAKDGSGRMREYGISGGAPPGREGGGAGWYAPASPSAAAKDGSGRMREYGIGAPAAPAPSIHAGSGELRPSAATGYGQERLPGYGATGYGQEKQPGYGATGYGQERQGLGQLNSDLGVRWRDGWDGAGAAAKEGAGGGGRSGEYGAAGSLQQQGSHLQALQVPAVGGGGQEAQGAISTGATANGHHQQQEQQQRQGLPDEGAHTLQDREQAHRMHLQGLHCRGLQNERAAMGPQARAEQQFEHARQVGLQERLRGQQELLQQQIGHNPAFFAGGAGHEGDGKEAEVAGGYGGALLRERPAAIQQRVNEAVLVGSRTVAMRAAHADEEMSAAHKCVSELEVQVWNSKHQLDDLVEIAHQLSGGHPDQGDSDPRLSPGRRGSNTGAKRDIGPSRGAGAGSNPMRTSMGLSMQAALSVGHMCFAPLLPPRASFSLSTSFSQFWAALATLRAKLSLVPSEVEGMVNPPRHAASAGALVAPNATPTAAKRTPSGGGAGAGTGGGGEGRGHARTPSAGRLHHRPAWRPNGVACLSGNTHSCGCCAACAAGARGAAGGGGCGGAGGGRPRAVSPARPERGAGPAPASSPADVEDALEDYRREALHLVKGIRRSVVTPLMRRYEAAVNAAEEEAQAMGYDEAWQPSKEGGSVMGDLEKGPAHYEAAIVKEVAEAARAELDALVQHCMELYGALVERVPHLADALEAMEVLGRGPPCCNIPKHGLNPGPITATRARAHSAGRVRTQQAPRALSAGRTRGNSRHLRAASTGRGMDRRRRSALLSGLDGGSGYGGGWGGGGGGGGGSSGLDGDGSGSGSGGRHGGGGRHTIGGGGDGGKSSQWSGGAFGSMMGNGSQGCSDGRGSGAGAGGGGGNMRGSSALSSSVLGGREGTRGGGGGGGGGGSSGRRRAASAPRLRAAHSFNNSSLSGGVGTGGSRSGAGWTGREDASALCRNDGGRSSVRDVAGFGNMVSDHVGSRAHCAYASSVATDLRMGLPGSASEHRSLQRPHASHIQPPPLPPPSILSDTTYPPSTVASTQAGGVSPTFTAPPAASAGTQRPLSVRSTYPAAPSPPFNTHLADNISPTYTAPPAASAGTQQPLSVRTTFPAAPSPPSNTHPTDNISPTYAPSAAAAAAAAAATNMHPHSAHAPFTKDAPHGSAYSTTAPSSRNISPPPSLASSYPAPVVPTPSQPPSSSANLSLASNCLPSSMYGRAPSTAPAQTDIGAAPSLHPPSSSTNLRLTSPRLPSPTRDNPPPAGHINIAAALSQQPPSAAQINIAAAPTQHPPSSTLAPGTAAAPHSYPQAHTTSASNQHHAQPSASTASRAGPSVGSTLGAAGASFGHWAAEGAAAAAGGAVASKQGLTSDGGGSSGRSAGASPGRQGSHVPAPLTIAPSSPGRYESTALPSAHTQGRGNSQHSSRHSYSPRTMGGDFRAGGTTAPASAGGAPGSPDHVSRHSYGSHISQHNHSHDSHTGRHDHGHDSHTGRHSFGSHHGHGSQRDCQDASDLQAGLGLREGEGSQAFYEQQAHSRAQGLECGRGVSSQLDPDTAIADPQLSAEDIIEELLAESGRSEHRGGDSDGPAGSEELSHSSSSWHSSAVGPSNITQQPHQPSAATAFAAAVLEGPPSPSASALGAAEQLRGAARTGAAAAAAATIPGRPPSPSTSAMLTWAADTPASLTACTASAVPSVAGRPAPVAALGPSLPLHASRAHSDTDFLAASYAPSLHSARSDGARSEGAYSPHAQPNPDHGLNGSSLMSDGLSQAAAQSRYERSSPPSVAHTQASLQQGRAPPSEAARGCRVSSHNSPQQQRMQAWQQRQEQQQQDVQQRSAPSCHPSSAASALGSAVEGHVPGQARDQDAKQRQNARHPLEPQHRPEQKCHLHAKEALQQHHQQQQANSASGDLGYDQGDSDVPLKPVRDQLQGSASGKSAPSSQQYEEQRELPALLSPNGRAMAAAAAAHAGFGSPPGPFPGRPPPYDGTALDLADLAKAVALAHEASKVRDPLTVMSPSRHRTALLSNVRHQTAASGGLHTFEPSSAHRTSAVQERLGNQPHCVYGSPSLSPKRGASEELKRQDTSVWGGPKPHIPLLPEDLHNSLKCSDDSAFALVHPPSPTSLQDSHPTNTTISRTHSAEDAPPLSLSSASLLHRGLSTAQSGSGLPPHARLPSSSLFSGVPPPEPRVPNPSYTPRTTSALGSTDGTMHTSSSNNTTANAKSANTAGRPPLPTHTHTSSIAAATAALPSSRSGTGALTGTTANTPQSSLCSIPTAATAASEVPTHPNTSPSAKTGHASADAGSGSTTHRNRFNSSRDSVNTAIAAIERALSCPLPPPPHPHSAVKGAHPSTTLTSRANSHAISPAASFHSSPSRISAAAFPAPLSGGTQTDRGSVPSGICRGGGVHDILGVRTTAPPNHQPVHKAHHQGHSSSWGAPVTRSSHAHSHSSSLVPEVTMGALPTARPLMHSHSSSLAEHSRPASNLGRAPAGLEHSRPTSTLGTGAAGLEGGAQGESVRGTGDSNCSAGRSFKFSDQPPFPASSVTAHRLSASGTSLAHSTLAHGSGPPLAYSSGTSGAHSNLSMHSNPAASTLSAMSDPDAASAFSTSVGDLSTRPLHGTHLYEGGLRSGGRMHSASFMHDSVHSAGSLPSAGLNAGGGDTCKAGGAWAVPGVPVDENAEYRAGVTSLRTAASANQMAYDSFQEAKRNLLL